MMNIEVPRKTAIDIRRQPLEPGHLLVDRSIRVAEKWILTADEYDQRGNQEMVAWAFEKADAAIKTGTMVMTKIEVARRVALIHGGRSVDYGYHSYVIRQPWLRENSLR